MTSIRGRLLGWLGIGLLVLFAGAGVVVYGTVSARMHERFEADLEADLDRLVAALELTIDPEHRAEMLRLGGLAMPDPNRDEAEQRAARDALRRYAGIAIHLRLRAGAKPVRRGDDSGRGPRFCIIDDRGRVIAAEGMRPEEHPVMSRPEHQIGRRRVVRDGAGGTVLELARRVRNVPFADPDWDRAWNQLWGDKPPYRVPTAHVAVRRSRAELDRFLGWWGGGLAVAGIVLAFLIPLTSWWVVRRGLAPVTDLSEQVATLEARSLDQRVDDSALPDELLPIAHQLNAALERIERSVDRERRTASHIAHELRTPIAELQSITEIAAKWPDEAELQARAVKDSHDVALHMGRVVAALLKVARAGAGEVPLVLDELDVVPVARAAWDGLGAAVTERSQQLDDALPDALRVRSDRDIAEAVVSSLLKNAIQHAPVGSTIRLAARATNGHAELVIANPAPDLEADDVAHMAEAFWRKDAARTRSEEGGLGLTLALELCRSADIQLEPRLRDGALELTLRFPS